MTGEGYSPCAVPELGLASFLPAGATPQNYWSYVQNLELDRLGGFSPVKALTPITATGAPTGQVYLAKVFADKYDNKWAIVFYRDTATSTIKAKASMTPSTDDSWYQIQYCSGAGAYSDLALSMAGIPEACSARGTLWVGNRVDPVLSLDMTRKGGGGFVVVRHDGSTNNGMLGAASQNLPRGWPAIFRSRLALIGPPGEEDIVYFSLLSDHSKCGTAGATQMFWRVDDQDGDRIRGFNNTKELILFKRYGIYQFSGEFDDDVVGGDGLPQASGFWQGSLRLDRIEGLYGATHHRQIALHHSGKLIYRSWDGWRSLLPPPPGVRVEKGTSQFTDREDYLFQDRMKGGGQYGATAPDDPATFKSVSFDCDTYEDFVQGVATGLEISSTLNNGGQPGGLKLIGDGEVKQTATAWANHELGGEEASKAVDNNANTMWRWAGGGRNLTASYLGLDLGSNTAITKLLCNAVACKGFGGNSVYFKIEVLIGTAVTGSGNDQRITSPTTVKTYESRDPNNWLSTDGVIHVGATARYVAFQMRIETGGSGDHDTHAVEVEVYAGTYVPTSGSYESKEVEIASGATRWGMAKAWHELKGQTIAYTIRIAQTSGGAYTDIALPALSDADTVDQVDLNDYINPVTYPIATWRFFKFKVALTGTSTVSPFHYHFLITWLMGSVESMLQGCGVLGEKVMFGLSHSAVFDEVHVKTRNGGWLVMNYGASVWPASFFEFNGAFYAVNGKHDAVTPPASLLTVDAASASALQATALTPSYDAGLIHKDKEFTALLLTYSNPVWESGSTAIGALDVWYNVDDEIIASPTGNLLTDLVWRKLRPGSENTICIQPGHLALTTARLPLPILEGNTKGRRVRFKFRSVAGVMVSIHVWQAGAREFVSDGLTGAGLDPRGDLGNQAT